MERSVGGHATEASQPCRKGRILDSMLALEEANEECRFVQVMSIALEYLLDRVGDLLRIERLQDVIGEGRKGCPDPTDRLESDRRL